MLGLIIILLASIFGDSASEDYENKASYYFDDFENEDIHGCRHESRENHAFGPDNYTGWWAESDNDEIGW